jgi:hypothetical protein
MSETEHAMMGRPYSDFPSEWGPAQGTPFSEQRLQWIEGNLVKGELRMAKGETLSWMKPHTPEQILRYLEVRRTGDEPEHSVAAGNAARTRLLEFLKREQV